MREPPQRRRRRGAARPFIRLVILQSTPPLECLATLAPVLPSARSQPVVCRYPKHIKEFEQRDAARRVASSLPNVAYPVYPAPVYQPYAFYLPGSYRINEFYEANWRRYPGGIFSSGGMADQDKSHTDKYVFISNGFVDRVFKTAEWDPSHLVSLCYMQHVSVPAQTAAGTAGQVSEACQQRWGPS